MSWNYISWKIIRVEIICNAMILWVEIIWNAIILWVEIIWNVTEPSFNLRVFVHAWRTCSGLWYVFHSLDVTKISSL